MLYGTASLVERNKEKVGKDDHFLHKKLTVIAGIQQAYFITNVTSF